MSNKIIAIVVISLFFAACKQDKTDLGLKKTELEGLLKQQTELNSKVAKLRKEIDALDTLAINQKKIKAVDITVASLQEFRHFIEASAVVESDQNNLITAKTPGFVINGILVKPGDQVSAGQTLCTVDNSALVQSLEAIKVQVNLAQTAFDRQKTLWDKKIGSEIQYLQAKAQKEASEKQKANLEVTISNTNIYAPYAGTIDAVNFKLGDNTAAFSPAQNFGGIRIVNNSRLKLTAKLADTYINKVHVGDRVKFVIPDLNNKEVEATVSYVAGTISDKRTFDIIVWLSNNVDLKPNMNATLKINDLSLKNVIVVSENIIQSSEGQKSLLVLTHEGGKSRVRKLLITTGENYGGLVVVNGLKEGDEIVTTGFSGINDGEEVKHLPL